MKIKLDEGAFSPKRAHATDAGLDIFAIHDGVVPARKSAIFHTGVHIQAPHESMGDVRPKSGLMFNHELLTFGTVDEGYDGEVMVKMFNFSDEDFIVRRGDKITQLVVTRVLYEDVEIVCDIESGERGNAGFGSTGR